MSTYKVYNADQLKMALTKAVGGDQILLAPADYGSVSITNKNYSSALTIQSTSLSNKAHLDALKISGSSNIKLTGLDVGYGIEAGAPSHTPMAHVTSSSNIAISQFDFHGNEDGNPSKDGLGLRITGSNNVSVSDSEFSDLSRGLYVLRSGTVSALNNEFHDIRTDGVNVAAATNIKLHGNSFYDFKPVAGDHADAIQFWNTGQTVGSSGISIKDNVVWIPDVPVDGTGVQGIWIANSEGLGYKNVVIQNNLVYSNDIWNGISVYGGKGVQILDNSLLSTTGDKEKLWVRLDGSTSVTLARNVFEDMLLFNGSKPSQTGNINLAKTPGLRDLFDDLRSPDSVFDLITPGVGYQSKLNPDFLGNPDGDDGVKPTDPIEPAKPTDPRPPEDPNAPAATPNDDGAPVVESPSFASLPAAIEGLAGGWATLAPWQTEYFVAIP